MVPQVTAMAGTVSGSAVMVVDILDPVLCVVVIVAALAIPVGVALWRALRGGGRWWHRLGRGLGYVLVVLLAQALLLAGVFLYVNRTYGFFGSWAELVGDAPAAPAQDVVPIQSATVRRVPVGATNPHPDGQLTGISMPGTDPAYAYVPVWLPPQYFEKQARRTRFPVLYYVGGVNDTGAHDNASVNLLTPTAALIKAWRINPFILVLLPGKIRSGMDSECTDIGQVKHESWILRTVLPRIEATYRVGRVRGSRFISGWSSGAFCSANLTSKYPQEFNAGFGLGPYYHPTYEGGITASMTQEVIDGNSVFRRLADDKVNRSVRYLSVMSRHDLQSWGTNPISMVDGQKWADGREFHALAQRKNAKQFTFILLNRGGHRTGTYLPYVQQCLEWLGQYGL